MSAVQVRKEDVVCLEGAYSALEIERNSYHGGRGRKSKGTIAKLKTCDLRREELDKFAEYVKNGTSLVGIRVATDVDSEVGRIFDVSDNGKVEVEFSGDDVKEYLLSEMKIDEALTEADLYADDMVLVDGEPSQYEKAYYPGNIQIVGSEETISSDRWEVHEESREQTEEIEEVLETSTLPVATEVELVSYDEDGEEKVLETAAVEIEPDTERKFGKFNFIIKHQDDGYHGWLYEGETLIHEAQVSDRFHAVRSELVLHYHSVVQDIESGDIKYYAPFLLAFAPENREAYHPGQEEEDVSDILEDLESGKGILQRVGVSTQGELYSGYRRTLAAIKAGLKEIPIEGKYFPTRVDFIEDLFNANKQRQKSPETIARERAVRVKYCSDEARKAQLQALSTQADTGKAKGTAWERVVADEDGVSSITAINQNKIIEFIDNCKDRELAEAVRRVFNKTGKTATTKQIIEYSNQDPVGARIVANLIYDGEAISVSKAMVKAGLVKPDDNSKENKRKNPNIHVPPSGAIPPKDDTIPEFNVNTTSNQVPSQQAPMERVTIKSVAVPDWLLRLTTNVMVEIDIDVNSGTQPATGAKKHFTGEVGNDGLKSDWQIAQDGRTKCFGALIVDTPMLDTWVRTIENQLAKGYMGEGIFIMQRPSKETRKRLSALSSASCDFYNTIDLVETGNKKNSKYEANDIYAYYFGDRWKDFYDQFSSVGDVRLARWAFDKTVKRMTVFDTNVEWQDVNNGSLAHYKGMQLGVSKDSSGEWHSHIDGDVVQSGLTDKGLAKTICVNAANERLNSQTAA